MNTPSSLLGIKEFFQRFWRLFAIGIFVIGASLRINVLVEWVRKRVAENLVLDAQGNYLLSTGWGWVLVIVFFLLALFFLLAVFYMWKAQGLHREVERWDRTEMRVLKKTFERMIEASTLILNQLYPPAKKPPTAYDKISNVYCVSANGDTDVKRRYDIRTLGETLHFWEVKIGVEDEALPITYPDKIDFKVKDLGKKRRASYLPSRNMDRRKEMVVFFLPQVSPEEKEPRRIQVTYTWPRMLNRLLQKGTENFSWEIDSRRRIPEIEFALYFQPSIGRVECEVTGKRPGNDLLEEIESDQGWPGWRYRIVDAPEEFKYELRLRKRAP